ncbi:MAG: hypothetical protein ACYC5A_10790 [Thermoleophilia bacterium]
MPDTDDKKKGSGQQGAAAEPQPITVMTQSGFKQSGQPRAFELDGKRFTVLSIKKTWKQDSGEGRRSKSFFRVHTHEGRSHDIARDENTGEWTLEPFASKHD